PQPKPLPRMLIKRDVKDIFGFVYEDFELVGYDADANIKAPIAV
ncbi:thymidylate synthase, partial [Rhizobium sp. CF142]